MCPEEGNLDNKSSRNETSRGVLEGTGYVSPGEQKTEMMIAIFKYLRDYPVEDGSKLFSVALG